MPEEKIENPSLKTIYNTLLEIREEVGNNTTNIQWLVELYKKLDDRVWYIVVGIIVVVLVQFFMPFILKGFNIG